MTISKKLALIISLALGMQFIAQANETNALSHTAESLSYEKNCILKFAQEIHHQNANIAQWLNETIMDSYGADIINIAIIVNNPTLTTESKIAIFLQKIQREEKHNRDQKNSNFAIAAGCAAIFTVFIGSAICAIIESIQNPYRLEYSPSKDLVKLTIRGESIIFPLLNEQS